MKKLLLVLPAIFLFLGCAQEEKIETVDLSVSEILGNWKLSATYISPGGQTNWQKVEDGAVYSFFQDASFKVSEGDCSHGVFTKEENVLNLVCSDKDETQSYYIQKLDSDTLELSVVGCIEACIYRFEKQ